MKSLQNLLFYLYVILAAASCTFSGGTKKEGMKEFITGTTSLDKVQDVHIINMIRAIGAPNNSVIVGGYKYYQWQHSRTFGVSTLFGGGSTTLYCNLTAETQSNKIKIINWYGNQCGIFLDPMGEYFADKLNIAVITDESEKKQNTPAPTVESDSDQKSSEPGKPVIDLRQKTQEQKIQEQNITNESKAISPDSLDSKPSAGSGL